MAWTGITARSPLTCDLVSEVETLAPPPVAPRCRRTGEPAATHVRLGADESVPPPTVFIVDDNPGVCEGLLLLTESVGLNARTYPSAEAFLESYDFKQPGCLILDIRMPGMDGLQLLEQELTSVHLPVIVLTAHGDVPMAARAFRAGAVNFLQKPFQEQILLETIQEAIERSMQAYCRRSRAASLAARLATLTVREREILDLVVSNETTKSIAMLLGLSPKTVDFHRVKIMQKMNATSAIDLVRMMLLCQDAC